MKRTFTADNTFEAIMALIREAIAFVKEHGGSGRALFISELVLEEMLTNIVKYAYDDPLAHRIEVVAAVTKGKVSLEIRDDGRPFDPLHAAPPPTGAPVRTQTIGGRGIHLVRTFVKEIAYHRVENRNVLAVRFPAKPA